MNKSLKRCASCHIKKPHDSYSPHKFVGSSLNASCDDCVQLKVDNGGERGIPKVRGRILRYPNYVLMMRATDIEPGILADKIIKKLMYAASNVKWGRVAGLAAPQIGYSVRLFIIGPEAFLNPQIVSQEGFYEVEEGCYSLEPQKYDYIVARPAFLVLRWEDVTGKVHEERFEGTKAQIIAHEVDHLEGILCVNKPKVSVV